MKGQYKVLLPDGRLQTVTYVADEKGYRAKVDYTPAAPGAATTAGAGLPVGAASAQAGFVAGGAGYGAGGYGAGAYGTGAYGAGGYGLIGGYGDG